MVIYDQGSNMTMLDILEVVVKALGEAILIGRLLLEKGRKQKAVAQ